MEKALYEVRPYVYLAIAIVTMITRNDSNIGLISSFILILCGYAIIRRRLEFRKEYPEQI